MKVYHHALDFLLIVLGVSFLVGGGLGIGYLFEIEQPLWGLISGILWASIIMFSVTREPGEIPIE